VKSLFSAIKVLATVGEKSASDTYGGSSSTSRPVRYTSSSTSRRPTSQIVQAGSLKTWNITDNLVEVLLNSDGRPINADVELWHGPDNTPYKMRVYTGNGATNPIKAFIATPNDPNIVAIRNIHGLNYSFNATISSKDDNFSTSIIPNDTPATLQGGALKTYPFPPLVESVAIKLNTDGRPLNARIELLQGPNNNKQVIEFYSEDGLERPFIAIIETPGSGNVVRVVNTAPVEFPLTAQVESYHMSNQSYLDPITNIRV
jgi:hypothetical protein